MRILGIESSSLVASAAIYEDGITMAEYTVDFKMTHSQTLLPMIDEMVKLVGIDLNTIDAIAVSGGPGSFTGLRIGSATAKGLGLALNKPLIHVPTLDATAYNLFGASGLICPIMDARRNQVYTGIYRFEKKFETVMDQDAMDMGELIEKLNAMGERVIFLGDGVPVYEYREINVSKSGIAARHKSVGGVVPLLIVMEFPSFSMNGVYRNMIGILKISPARNGVYRGI